ncbi:uncharacterized protein [Medicago truncatula]|uniref:uncharacterized protein n=1 Tax=Medicago truncatula TaxID=3880 RepID=UPI001967D06C|nr:uncharacterized protein LOC120576958 [Medicago truncatula]
MSRLDRFMVSEKWCVSWPNCIQVAHQRGLSDHVPVVLDVDNANWGPRPLQWHQQHFKNLDGKILEAKNQISSLDIKGEEAELLEEEVKELHDLSVQLHSMARVQTSMNWQKARMNWVREGDANSKNFHNMMSSRQRRNAIHLVHVDGVLVEGVQNIHTAVYNHYSSHFRALDVLRPGVDGLNFRKLSYTQAASLVQSFSLEEFKQAVWDCESFKSPGPDCFLGWLHV